MTLEAIISKTVIVLTCITMLWGVLFMTTLDYRTELFYKHSNETVLAAFRSTSNTHRRFAENYQTCNQLFLPKINKVCVQIASLPLQDQHNIEQVIHDFFNLKLNSFNKTMQFWGLFNPLSIYDAWLNMKPTDT